MTNVKSLTSFLTQIEVDKIDPNKFKLRELDETIVKELMESIKANGLLQPIVVRPVSNLRYELVFGLHRLEALKRLGLKFIPAIIVSVSEEEAFLMNVVENLQRNIKINPIMEAQGYKSLIAKGWTIHEIALKIGKSDSYVYERLRLLDKLHPAIQKKLTSRACKTAITPSHAERLTLISDKTQQLKLAKLIEEKHLSLHQLERLTRKIQQSSLPKNCLCVKCPNYPCKLLKNLKESRRMNKIKLPSRKECFELLKKYNTPKNILKHSITVNRFANRLTKLLIAKGIPVNKTLVDRAALLHDIGKFEALNKGESHEEKGYKILKKEGFNEIANIVKKHSLFSVLNKKEAPTTWEEKIVFYADKRVNEDKVVTLEERIVYLKKRYGKNKRILKRIEAAEPLIYQIEKEIFSVMGK